MLNFGRKAAMVNSGRRSIFPAVKQIVIHYNFLAFGHKFLEQITYIILILTCKTVQFIHVFCIACFMKKYKGHISISQTVKGLLVDYDLLFILNLNLSI